MAIIFNEQKATSVFRILDKEWREQKGVFSKIVLPQDRWPLPEDKRELALFLFYSALFMRGGVVSEDPMRLLFALKHDFPNFFEPHYVVKHLSPAFIEDALRKTIPVQLAKNGKSNGRSNSNVYKLDEHSKAWFHNSEVLEKYYMGDPLNIFHNIRDFEEAFGKINHRKKKGAGILGMRRKIFSLLTIWFQEKNLVSFFPTPIPVDFHALRILWATGIIDFPNLVPFEPQKKHSPSLKGKIAIRITEKIIDEIMLWSQNFIHKIKLSHVIINPALWILSRDLCMKSYPNSSFTEGGLIRLREPEDLKNMLSWPANYRDPCYFCPIEEFCYGSIPASPYYRWSLLLKMPKTKYKSPQLLSLAIDWRKFFQIPRSNRSQK